MLWVGLFYDVGDGVGVVIVVVVVVGLLFLNRLGFGRGYVFLMLLIIMFCDCWRVLCDFDEVGVMRVGLLWLWLRVVLFVVRWLFGMFEFFVGVLREWWWMFLMDYVVECWFLGFSEFVMMYFYRYYCCIIIYLNWIVGY